MLSQSFASTLSPPKLVTTFCLHAQELIFDLRYVHQDHLIGTALVTDTLGNQVGSIKYYPYGSTRSGFVPTDKKFTGQRLDGTGLYYYRARYYDSSIVLLSLGALLAEADTPVAQKAILLSDSLKLARHQ